VLSSGTADKILTGGLVANIMLAAGGLPVGQGSLNYLQKTGNDQHLPAAKVLYEKYADKILLPEDLAWVEDGQRNEKKINELPYDVLTLDIGTATAKRYEGIIKNAGTVFVNGPMGVFEQPETEAGTGIVWNALGNTKAFTVIGGGDSITAATRFGITGQIGYICTGGGALIRFLTGEELPVVKALRHAAKEFPCA
jgi:phosphoglycerate kinase